MTDKLQSRIKEWIRQYVKSKDLKSFEEAVIQVDKCAADLKTAKSKQKDIIDAAYTWGRAALKLWGIEKRLLEQIVAGIKQAKEVHISKVNKLAERKRQIEQDYRDQRIIEPKGTKEEKQARADKNRELKAKMVKDMKALNIKAARANDLAPLQGEVRSIQRDIRALASKSAVMFPIEPTSGNHPYQRSPLDQVDLVDQAVMDWAIRLDKKVRDRIRV